VTDLHSQKGDNPWARDYTAKRKRQKRASVKTTVPVAALTAKGVASAVDSK